MSAAAVPHSVDLNTINAKIRGRVEALFPASDASSTQPIAQIRQRAPHVFGDKAYEIHPTNASLASLIDHTILKADARLSEVESLCAEAIEHKFATVCVNGSRVSDVVTYFRKHAPNGAPGITCVVGFPLGAMTPAAKAFEISELHKAGADEFDMVINVGKLKDGNYAAVYQDILACKHALDAVNADVSAAKKKKMKVILETCLLSDIEIIDACLLSVAAGVDFVKTSTGFSTGGAVGWQVQLMKLVVGAATEVKASGGIRDAATAGVMVSNGATRLGCSASVKIAQGAPAVATADGSKY